MNKVRVCVRNQLARTRPLL